MDAASIAVRYLPADLSEFLSHFGALAIARRRNMPYLKPYSLHCTDVEGPISGGILCTFISGTTNPIKTYKDENGALHKTQIQLDANGDCNMWLDPTVSYKFVLYDRVWTPVWVKDNITVESLNIKGVF